jgi:hypothetical protein
MLASTKAFAFELGLTSTIRTAHCMGADGHIILSIQWAKDESTVRTITRALFNDLFSRRDGKTQKEIRYEH